MEPAYMEEGGVVEVALGLNAAVALETLPDLV
jgi:hypothetical protein